MAKKRVYAIGYGVNPETGEIIKGLKVNTWDECQRYIAGVTNARYKGFYTHEEADIWLEETLGIKKSPSPLKNPSPSLRDSVPTSYRSSSRSVNHNRFRSVSSDSSGIDLSQLGDDSLPWESDPNCTIDDVQAETQSSVVDDVVPKWFSEMKISTSTTHECSLDDDFNNICKRLRLTPDRVITYLKENFVKQMVYLMDFCVDESNVER